ncbi:MAG: TlpA disulfide reductase family protein [Bryobacteraceae bacterium]
MLTRIVAGALALVTLSWPAGNVPRPAPELAVKLPNGEQLLLSRFRGKVVAVEFLLTTCPACREASRLLEKLYQEYGPRGFQPIGVAFNDMAMMLVPDYIKDQHLTFPVGVGTRESVLDFLQHPPMMRMLVPQLVFVDRKGIIRAQYAADDPFFIDKEKNMRLQIESLLAEGNPSPKKAAPQRTRTKTASGVK